MSLPVALQLYSVRDEAAADFKGTLKNVKEMGYDGVEFAGLHGLSADEVKATVTALGLEPISAHVSLDEMLSDVDGVMKTYSSIGCKFIVVPYMPEDRRPGTPGFAETVGRIAEIGKAANANGMTLLYHNHDFEFVNIDGEYGLDLLYRLIPAELLETELDTCWVNVGGEDPAKYLLKYTGRAPVVHLKDFVMNGKGEDAKLYELIGIDDDKKTEEDAFSFKPVGYGVQDMPAILDASVKAGAGWVVVEQDRPAKGDTPMASAKMSRDYLKTLGW